MSLQRKRCEENEIIKFELSLWWQQLILHVQSWRTINILPQQKHTACSLHWSWRKDTNSWIFKGNNQTLFAICDVTITMAPTNQIDDLAVQNSVISHVPLTVSLSSEPELHWLGQHKSTGIAGLLPFRAAARHVRLQISNPGQILANSHEWWFLSFSFSSVWFHLKFDFFRVLVRVEFGYMMKHKIHPRSRGIGGCISTRAETNTSSTRLPGSSNYLNYPIASIRIR